MLLHVIANPRGPESRSRRVARAFLEGFREAHPGVEVREVELFDRDLPMTDALDVNTRVHQFYGRELEGAEADRFARFREVIQPLLEAERLVITTPMWNFGPPWKLKQWLDTVIQARVTFQYTAQGPQGLLRVGKAAVLGSRGGAYADGDPRETKDFLVPYLQAALGFLGVQDVSVVMADGLDAEPQRADEVLAAAEDRARALGASF